MVGRRNDPGVGFNCFFGSKRGEIAALQDMQEFGLKRQGHVADFIQKQHPAMRLLKLTPASSFGTGKGPLFVAEHFAFKKAVG